MSPMQAPLSAYSCAQLDLSDTYCPSLNAQFVPPPGHTHGCAYERSILSIQICLHAFNHCCVPHPLLHHGMCSYSVRVHRMFPTPWAQSSTFPTPSVPIRGLHGSLPVQDHGTCPIPYVSTVKTLYSSTPCCPHLPPNPWLLTPQASMETLGWRNFCNGGGCPKWEDSLIWIACPFPPCTEKNRSYIISSFTELKAYDLLSKASVQFVEYP